MSNQLATLPSNLYLEELRASLTSTKFELDKAISRLNWFVRVYDATKTADTGLEFLQNRVRILVSEMKETHKLIKSIEDNESRISKTMRYMGWND